MTIPARVALVGAGPGDPDLLTRKAWQLLREAEVVYYDGLVPAAVVRVARRARRVSVARRAGPKTVSDADVVRGLVESAAAGHRTVRLKAGDPFVLGRGYDEMAALGSAGIACDVVPGVTSATAAPVLAGIPLTIRGVSAGFLVVSGHAAEAYAPLLAALPPGALTVVVLMGMRQRDGIRDVLLAAGWPPETPVAVITDASRPSQQRWIGVLGALAGDAMGAPVRPGVIVIGAVVAHALSDSAIPLSESQPEAS